MRVLARAVDPSPTIDDCRSQGRGHLRSKHVYSSTFCACVPGVRLTVILGGGKANLNRVGHLDAPQRNRVGARQQNAQRQCVRGQGEEPYKCDACRP